MKAVIYVELPLNPQVHVLETAEAIFVNLSFQAPAGDRLTFSESPPPVPA